MKAGIVPNISFVAANTSVPRSKVKIAAAMRVRNKIVSASFEYTSCVAVRKSSSFENLPDAEAPAMEAVAKAALPAV